MNIIRKLLYPTYQPEHLHKEKIDYALKMVKFLNLKIDILKRYEPVIVEKNNCKYAVVFITANNIPVDVTINCFDLDRMRPWDLLGYIVEWVVYREVYKEDSL